MADVKRDASGKWLPGHCPNPSGRPPADPDLIALCKAHTEEAVHALVHIMRTAIKDENRLKAIEILFERAYGRPLTVEVSQDSTTPLKPIVVQVVSDK